VRSGGQHAGGLRELLSCRLVAARVGTTNSTPHSPQTDVGQHTHTHTNTRINCTIFLDSTTSPKIIRTSVFAASIEAPVTTVIVRAAFMDSA